MTDNCRREVRALHPQAAVAAKLSAWLEALWFAAMCESGQRENHGWKCWGGPRLVLADEEEVTQA